MNKLKTRCLWVIVTGFFLMNVTEASQVKKPIILNPDSLTWDEVHSMPPGVEVAVLSGDPTKKEPFVARIKIPAGYTVPVHSHAINEYDTVISGGYYLGFGHKVDMKQGTLLRKGSFVMIPAKMKHYGWTREETILQI